MALDSLASTFTVTLGFTAQKNQAGANLQPNQNASSIRKVSSVGTAAANNAAGGGNELASFLTTIAGGGSATIDLTSLTDILLATGTNLARVKGIMMQLLSAADDATNGTAAAYVTVGNNGSNDWVSQSGGRGWFTTAASQEDIPNGGAKVALFPNASGVLVDGTHRIIKVTNGDGTLTAAVQTSLQGATT